MLSGTPGGGQPAPPANTGDGICYLIHFDRRYQHAGHYLGWTPDLEARLEAHRTGRGARLMEVVTDAGITWHVSRTWPGGRSLERALKGRKEAPRLCPDCTPHPAPVSRGAAAAPRTTAKQATTGRAAAEQPAQAPTRLRENAYERGARMGRNFLRSRDGQPADQIEAAFTYVSGPFRADTPDRAETYRGFADTVAAAVTRRRQAEAEPELEAGA
jgi:predicted GIY-YIG superfamily endonuclease